MKTRLLYTTRALWFREEEQKSPWHTISQSTCNWCTYSLITNIGKTNSLPCYWLTSLLRPKLPSLTQLLFCYKSNHSSPLYWVVKEESSSWTIAQYISSPEQANEWAVWPSERTDERSAQYFSLYSWLLSTIVTRPFQMKLTKTLHHDRRIFRELVCPLRRGVPIPAIWKRKLTWVNNECIRIFMNL